MKLLLVLQGLGGSCPFFRSIGPFKRIEKYNPDIKVQIVDISQKIQPFWIYLTNADVIYFERPRSDLALNLLREALCAGIKVWVDYDDDLMNLPKWNPAHKNNGSRNKIIEECVLCANLITVSTLSLQDMFIQYNDNVHVIPNAFDSHLLKDGFKFSRRKIIYWRGSATHDGDLEILCKAYEKIQKKHNDWSWCIMGGGNQSQNFFKNKQGVTLLDSTSLLFYFKKLLKTNPGILLYPLVDTFFNHCKSHIAWLEATYFGAVTIAPDFPEWEKEGCLVNYKKPEDIPQHVSDLIEDEDARQKMYVKARRIIYNKYMIDEINKLRVQLLCVKK